MAVGMLVECDCLVSSAAVRSWKEREKVDRRNTTKRKHVSMMEFSLNSDRLHRRCRLNANLIVVFADKLNEKVKRFRISKTSGSCLLRECLQYEHKQAIVSIKPVTLVRENHVQHSFDPIEKWRACSFSYWWTGHCWNWRLIRSISGRVVLENKRKARGSSQRGVNIPRW